MADFTLQALKAELDVDPDALGYAAAGWPTAGDQEIADLLNNKSGANPYTVNHASVDTGLLRAEVTFEAFDGLTAAEADWFSWLTSAGEIVVRDHLLADLAGIGGTSRWAVAERDEMEAALAPLLQFQGGRAQFLWGEGVNISAGQVGAAANV